MKLRLDLLEHLTDQDILEEVLANNHRYKPEPLFSKTGVGSLSPASTEERANEVARSTALIEKLKLRAQASGRKNSSKSSPSPKQLPSCGSVIAALPSFSSTATPSRMSVGKSPGRCLPIFPPPVAGK